MFKKFSNLHLLGLFIVMGLVYYLLQSGSDSKRSSSFREDLVQIDTSQVTKIVIVKGNNMVELHKDGASWNLSLENGKVVPAVGSTVKNALSTLETIQPSRVASKQPGKWGEYQVDSSGTSIQVFEGGAKTLDLIIGKFGIKGQRQFYTHVRLADENEVYVADNFMGISFPFDPASYRDKSLIRFNADSVQQLNFQFPADSSYTLLKSVEGKWVINSRLADSAATAKYLQGIRYLSGKQFADDVEPGSASNEVFSLVIKRAGEEDITIKAYPHPKYSWILNSSLNQDAYFSEQGTDLLPKIFKGQQELL